MGLFIPKETLDQFLPPLSKKSLKAICFQGFLLLLPSIHQQRGRVPPLLMLIPPEIQGGLDGEPLPRPAGSQETVALPRRTSPPHFPTALPRRSPHSGQAGGRAQLGNRPLFSAAERVLAQDRRAASQTGRKRRELLRPDQPLSPSLSSPLRRSPARRKGPAFPN